MSTVQLPERCYTLDVVYPLMVVGTAERHIQIFNLSNPTTPFKVGFVAAASASGNTDCLPSDYDVATQVANSCRLVLPLCKRICRRQCRRTCSYTVRTNCDRKEVVILIVMTFFLDTSKTKTRRMLIPTVFNLNLPLLTIRYQEQLLIQVSSQGRCPCKQGSIPSIRCERYHLPPCARNVLHLRCALDGSASPTAP